MMASLPPIDVPKGATGAGAFDPRAEVRDRPLFDYLLRLGDDSLILGQRLGEWCGHAPSVEVDLSLANIALDLIGQATHFLTQAGEVEGKGRDGDRRSEEHTSELQSLMRISYAVFRLKKKK